MIRSRFAGIFLIVFGLSSAAFELAAAETPGATIPPFAEVYSVIRSNLAGVTEADLNRAAVLGLLGQLQSRATLLTNGAPGAVSSELPAISKITALEGAYGFVRIAQVRPGLSSELARQVEQLRSTNALKGIVIDLRYAVGDDYAAAAETADLLFRTEQPLLRWGDVIVRSTAKKPTLDLPVVVLVNGHTSGAAEALAAVLRQADAVLVIGSPTAGRAFVFKNIPLSGGQVLRVASGFVAAGDGQSLVQTGVVPDIALTVNPEEEKGYFEDPYTVFTRPFAQGTTATNELWAAQSTNRPRRRMNEAELVRMQRDGLDFEAEQVASNSLEATEPVITDPALSRGLDLLKGLALAFKRP